MEDAVGSTAVRELLRGRRMKTEEGRGVYLDQRVSVAAVQSAAGGRGPWRHRCSSYAANTKLNSPSAVRD